MSGGAWDVVALAAAWLIARLAQITASYRAAKRRDELKARRAAP